MFRHSATTSKNQTPDFRARFRAESTAMDKMCTRIVEIDLLPVAAERMDVGTFWSLLGNMVV